MVAVSDGDGNHTRSMLNGDSVPKIWEASAPIRSHSAESAINLQAVRINCPGENSPITRRLSASSTQASVTSSAAPGRLKNRTTHASFRVISHAAKASNPTARYPTVSVRTKVEQPQAKSSSLKPGSRLKTSSRRCTHLASHTYRVDQVVDQFGGRVIPEKAGQHGFDPAAKVFTAAACRVEQPPRRTPSQKWANLSPPHDTSAPLRNVEQAGGSPTGRSFAAVRPDCPVAKIQVG